MYDLTSSVRRISALSNHFMPDLRKPVFSADEEDSMHAFRLLVHAEIERLIEDWAEMMNGRLATANKTGLPTWMAHHVLLHFEQAQTEHGYPPRQLSAQRLLRPVGKKTPKDRIVAALNVHASLIDGNNGVSQKDVIKLFLPIGVELSWFNTHHQWLDSMDLLANARGAVAHGSVGVRTAPTPQSERSLLVQPIVGLRQLAAELERLAAGL